MSETIKLENNSLTQYKFFRFAVEAKMARYLQDKKPFYLFLLEFNVLDTPKHSASKDMVIEFIAKTINDNITEGQNSYTIDEAERFLILFSEIPYNTAFILMSRIFYQINKKFSGHIDFYTGCSIYPDNVATYEDMVNQAGFALTKTKERNYKIAQMIDKSNESKTIADLEVGKSILNITNNLKNIMFEEIQTLIFSISNYDDYLREHSALVTRGSVMLAKELCLPWAEVEKIAIAALLHDIGYTSIPKWIFQKPDKLTPKEWSFIKSHPTIACDHILKPAKILNEYIPLIQDHHEFLDGSGYPKGKAGTEIPVGAQIISIIDSYQAMTVDRPYRKAVEFDQIMDIYIKNSGIKWYDFLIMTFVSMINDPDNRVKIADKTNFSLESLKY